MDGYLARLAGANPNTLPAPRRRPRPVERANALSVLERA